MFSVPLVYPFGFTVCFCIVLELARKRRSLTSGFVQKSVGVVGLCGEISRDCHVDKRSRNVDAFFMFLGWFKARKYRQPASRCKRAAGTAASPESPRTVP